MEPWMAQARRQHGVISTAELRRFGPAPTSGASQGRGTRRRTADHGSRPLGRGQGRGFVQVGSGSLAVRWIRAKTPGCILGTAIRATYVIPTGRLSISTPPSEAPRTLYRRPSDTAEFGWYKGFYACQQPNRHTSARGHALWSAVPPPRGRRRGGEGTCLRGDPPRHRRRPG